MTIAITDLNRHPIKSHGVEVLERATLIAGKCLPWDRKFAVTHEAARFDLATPAWAPCANFSRGSKAPGLMAIKARVDEDAGLVHLTHPDLEPLSINPENEDDAAALIEWTRPIMPKNRSASTRLVSAPDRGMTDTDYASVSIASKSSLQALSEKTGEDLSHLRFRGNIWFEGAESWAEFNWIGKELRIGAARLVVREPIVRCLATTANPETGERDVDTLAALNDGWGHQNFGVYAEVVAGGPIGIGDTVELL